MTERQSERTHTTTYEVITRGAILHLEDALEIDKVRLRLYRCKKGQGAQAVAFHYLGVANARVLFSDLAQGNLPEEFVDFKGSPTARDGKPCGVSLSQDPQSDRASIPHGKPLSRVLKVQDTAGKTRSPIVFEASNGLGQVIGQGAVKPAGEPDAKVAILISRVETHKMAYAVLEYLQAYAVVQMLHPAEAPPRGGDGDAGGQGGGERVRLALPEPLPVPPAPPGRPAQPESPVASTATPPPAATATDFWTAVYGRDLSQEDGRLLLDRAGNDYGRALVLLAQHPA
jgi:hypothetical protein